MTQDTMTLPRVVSREEWLAARKELLEEEDQLSEQHATVAAHRRELPMVEVEKDYHFEGMSGTVRLLDLFEGRQVLVVQHVMWIPERKELCPHCTSQMRDLGYLPHLHEQGITLALVSRGPQGQLEEYVRNLPSDAPAYSSLGSDFNYDFYATLDDAKAPGRVNFQTKEEYERSHDTPWESFQGEHPATSVFLRDGDRVFHTYSVYASGIENLIFTMNYANITPFGL